MRGGTVPAVLYLLQVAVASLVITSALVPITLESTELLAVAESSVAAPAE